MPTLRSTLAALAAAMSLVASLDSPARDLTPRDQRMARFALSQARIQTLAAARSATTSSPLSAEESLGALLFADQDLSLKRNQACASCHSLQPAIDGQTGKPLPVAAFVDPRNVRNGSAVSKGSVSTRTGTLNAPSIAYASFSPFFFWNAVDGLYMGGQFWNGRASTLRDQAAEPFLARHEMVMPSRAAVIARLQEKVSYLALFARVYGINLSKIPSANSSAVESGAIDAVYTAMTRAIAAFEKSRTFNRFTSKFDYFLSGATALSAAELRGLDVFNGQGNCAACHPSTATFAPDGSVMPPLFTDFSYDNIGLPRNVDIPGNPTPNRGLGGRVDIAARDPSGADLGKHKVMGLRNIALTAPYGHNGVFRTLETIVHFYNTRDVLGRVADIHTAGFGTTGWPAPEISRTVNHEELGALGLNDAQEADLVSFLGALSDGYPDWGRDPRVPTGTPSPYADMPFPPLP